MQVEAIRIRIRIRRGQRKTRSQNNQRSLRK
jgi:hypothetical protein